MGVPHLCRVTDHTHSQIDPGFGLIKCAWLWQSFIFVVTQVLFGRKMSICDITWAKLPKQLLQVWSFAFAYTTLHPYPTSINFCAQVNISTVNISTEEKS